MNFVDLAAKYRSIRGNLIAPMKPFDQEVCSTVRSLASWVSKLLRCATDVVLLVSLIVPGIITERVTAQDVTDYSVSMFLGNPARNGKLPGSAPDEPIVRHWVFETEGNIGASPAVAGGVADISSADGYPYAIDAATSYPK